MIDADMSAKMLAFTTEVDADYLNSPAFGRFVERSLRAEGQNVNATECNTEDDEDTSSIASDISGEQTKGSTRNKKTEISMWHTVPSCPNPEESFCFDSQYNPLFQDEKPGTHGNHCIVFSVDIQSAKSATGMGNANVIFSDIDKPETEFRAKLYHLNNEGSNDVDHRQPTDDDITRYAFESIVVDAHTALEGKCNESGHQNSVLRKKIPEDFGGENVPRLQDSSTRCYDCVDSRSEAVSSLHKKDIRKRRATGGFFLKSPETGSFIAIG
ncbi:hypothetical protein JR316_0006314 [Psilocybe cubensis]|uniref:Uncharacterized protein n=1 Tax=Psilocybe cubensis TaxID=181762 RepID=A0ACB8H292_PSICU|nr:hypothetical protein JR316_0006314 [Psilocybe cubensis]KAH9481787.1 hypothetical protein JR316_0006314 [Psilocybe cubensis]